MIEREGDIFKGWTDMSELPNYEIHMECGQSGVEELPNYEIHIHMECGQSGVEDKKV